MQGRLWIHVLVLLAFPATAVAHSGGLDRHGCHTNRSTGQYHCHRGPAPAAASTLAPAPLSAATPSTGRRADGGYANCAAARAAGAAPLRRGQPGYGAHLDRDGDGVACEPWRGR